MSYSIAEGVEDQERRLASMRAILAQYPDATQDGMPDGTYEWRSERLKNPTHVRVYVDKKGNPVFCPYALIEGHALFVDWWRCEEAILVMSRLRDHWPEAYAGLIEAVISTAPRTSQPSSNEPPK